MTKPSVLFIHGMWGSPKLWENFVARFEATGYKTQCVTLRHHDKLITEPAPEGLGTTSLQDYVDDVVEVVNALDDKPILVGHSMGGLIAQMVAARTDIAAVIALTPAPPAGVLALKPSTIKVFRKILFSKKFWKNPTRLDWDAARYGLYHNLPEDEARAHYADMVWESGKATYEIAFWTLDRTKAAKLNRANIDCPVLMISGGKDRTVDASVVKASAKRYKGKAEYVDLPEHSHWLIGEQGWENVVDRCLDFISAA